MGQEFYLEIGSEEIPAGYIGPALEAMAGQMVRFLTDHRIAHGTPVTTGTPRRLCLCIPDVAERQEASTTEIIGPPKSVAFDEAGNPTKAAEGFARNQGVQVSELAIKSTPKGEYVCLVKEEAGLPTRDLLQKMLPDFVAHIPFPKSMRWGSLSVTFARPVHWIVCLLGGQVVEFNYGDVTSGDRSFGHRFMAPEWIPVTGFQEHKKKLADHRVIVDMGERRDLILQGIREKAAEVGGTILEDPDLLDEVTNLLEYPYPLLGSFEEKYLALPPELLITVMKEHQRYFAITDAQDRLMPHFVTVANTVPRDPALVAAGNARVVRARLEDARFYYEEDQKVPLEDRAEELKSVVFHAKLGTSWEKVERFTALAQWLCDRLCPEKRDAVTRAAFLCKADLVSGMVGEFPELQGIMGRAYARLQGEPEQVAQAIYEHYLPNRAGGPLPEGMEGTILSLADKMDTIVGCFGVGLLPTGTADPFALRRQTLGIIRIVLAKNLRFSLGAFIDQALPLLEAKMTEPQATVKAGVLDFFRGRLHHHLVSQEGLRPDIVDAALSVGIDDLVDAVARVRALAAFTQRPDFESLAVAVKRVGNIIKEGEKAPVEPEVFQAQVEKALHDAYEDAAQQIQARVASGDYDGALAAAAALREPIDAFFEGVLVMDKDETVRRNRLALLTAIHGLFNRIADFRKVQTA
ncbi:glycyl-tRNA synthetase beta chain [Desulfacinum hydrothermale DSM 13146]|uniref:Glycine--tRNA ligase beta subunit n=1 Tax=Desulfacinum hydrothermale DSM 13146 TaxID=1121390 RepID=A0A1W1XGI6_9BACT|nr:glycine--tRNA ligase subunit beta [Desulfacinum hydrothermale]SMC23069.1 glycyl-tRNA synthetase beta chain [Desulfacinum hydrothermale DSM 13146]